MIYSIKGIVSHIEQNIAIIECNGIGYSCYVSNSTLMKLSVGKEGFLYTHMNVKEDAIDLYGFINQSELKCFKVLISVSGVGPKAGISILSEFSPESLSSAVALNDVKAITRCHGIGPKVAQRIILELKDKLKVVSDSDEISSNFINEHGEKSIVAKEAVEALKSLGYLESDAKRVISKYDIGTSVEDMIKRALKEL